MAEPTSAVEARRLELSQKLREILGSDNVYYQPPESVQMHYPCIRYKRSMDNIVYANNKPYLTRNRYELMVISQDPTEPVAELIPKTFEYCSSTRPRYVADNLHHAVFTIYW